MKQFITLNIKQIFMRILLLISELYHASLKSYRRVKKRIVSALIYHDNVLYAVFTVCCECTVQVLLLSALLKVLKGDSHLFYFNKISSDLTMAMSTSIQCQVVIYNTRHGCVAGDPLAVRFPETCLQLRKCNVIFQHNGVDKGVAASPPHYKIRVVTTVKPHLAATSVIRPPRYSGHI